MVFGPAMQQPMHYQHAAAVRQAGLATMKVVNTGLNYYHENCSTWYGAQVMGVEKLVRAVESLYADQIQPLSRILKRRIVEQAGDSNLRSNDIDRGALRDAVSAAAPMLSVSDVEGGDWEAVLNDRAPTFVDPHDPLDVYPETMWQAFSTYITSLQDKGPKEHRFPASRYACALHLQERDLPFFAGVTLGALCHIVQLSTSQKQILGYLDGALVPYLLSNCYTKKKHAELGIATAANSEEQSLPFADMISVRAYLAEIMELARWSEAGCEPLANIKRTFRSRYHLELSETLLGYTKLSELLRDLPDLCYLEMRNSGCCVVPAALNPAGNGSLSQSLGSQSLGSMLNAPDAMACVSQTMTEQLCQLEEGSEIRSMVKNTFIELPLQREGARVRSRSVPKDFGSTKDDRETACHVLSFQHRPVNSSAFTRSVVITRHGYGLGLDVSDDCEALLIEDVGPGPVELWNLSHPEEVVQIGDRILQVNGVSGNASELLSAIQASDTLELVVEPKMHSTKDDSTASTASSQSLKNEWTLQDLTSTPCSSEAGDLLMDMQPPATSVLQIPAATSGPPCEFAVPSSHVGPRIIAAAEVGKNPYNPQGGKIFIHSGPPPFLMA